MPGRAYCLVKWGRHGAGGFPGAMCLTEVKVNGTWWLSGLAGSTIHAASHGVEGLLGVRCGLTWGQR